MHHNELIPLCFLILTILSAISSENSALKGDGSNITKAPKALSAIMHKNFHAQKLENRIKMELIEQG